MRDYKLVVTSQDNTSNVILDLDDVNIPIVFNVKDVREPNSIKTNYTKQFEIPTSHNNNSFFDGLYEKGFSVNKFNPNFKIDCQLMLDENVIIDGYLQVVDVNRIDQDGYYSIIIYGELSSLFNNIISYKLSDIDLSEYNHNWTYNNVKDSWATSIKRNNLNIPFLMGRGYVYPLIWKGQQENDFKVEDFTPAVFVKTIMDKIFDKAGKKYKSEFLNSKEFKNLILPYSKTKLYLSDEEKNKRLFSAKVESTDFNDLGYAGYKKHYTGGVTNVWTSPKYKINFPTEIADPNNVFFNGDTYIPKNKENNSVGVNLNIKTIFRAAPGQSAGFLIVGPTIKGNIYLKNETTGQFIYSEKFEVVHSTGIVGALSTDYVVNTKVFFDYSGLFLLNNKYSIYIDYTMAAGPKASKFVNTIGQSIGGFIFNGVGTDSSEPTEIFNTSEQEYILEGDVVDMNQVLPSDITCIDFLKDINKMFNLYWIATDEDTFRIEPRDVFYSFDEARIYDWTHKVNEDEQQTITPMAELNNKQYSFTYSEDSDYYNDLYTLTFKEVYGQKIIEVQNDFITDVNKIDLKFSPSPMVKILETDMVAPAFMQIEESFTEKMDVKQRILIYGGLVNTSEKLKFNSVQFNQYPYCGHFDNPKAPTVDLNWGKTKEYYYDWVVVPDDNLYEAYWKNNILDIVSPDSHMLSAEFHLTPLDVIKLNIFDTIQVGEVYYKINRLEYDLMTEIAKVELFKTFTYLSFPAKKITSPGNSGVITKPINNPTKPGTTFVPGGAIGWGGESYIYKNGWNKTKGVGDNVWGIWTNQTSLKYDGWTYKKFNEDIYTNKKINNNTYSKGNLQKLNVNENTYRKGSWTEIMGKSNYVAPSALGISIKGNNNRVGDNVKNVSIMGKNNFIEGGVENTQVIGDGLYVTKSNAIYLDGNIIEKGSIKQPPNFIGNMINRTSIPCNSGDKIDLIKCPINAVQNTGGVSRFNLINCGVDNSLEFLF